MKKKELIQQMFRIQERHDKILYSTVDDYRFEKESQNESGLCKAKKLLDNLRKSMKKDGLI
jgi:hypothetical protein